MPQHGDTILLEIDEKLSGTRRQTRKVRVSADRISLGTSATNDIDLTLYREAFGVELSRDADTWWLINKSKSPAVRTENYSVVTRHPLKDGDLIFLDEHKLYFRRSEIQKKKSNYEFTLQPESDEALWSYLVEEDQLDEVMINGAYDIFVDFRGSLLKSPWGFSSNEFLAQKICEATGSTHGWSAWRLNKFLRIHAAQSPLVEFPHICIRKGRPHVFSLDELIERNFGSEEQIQFLKDCIHRRENILISGPTSSGKTVLMRSMVEEVPAEERVLILEEEAETTWPHPHAVLLETGRGGLKEGIRECLRMRPSRLIVSEIRGDEAVDFLQSINTGHRGSITTMHANSTRDAITRIETLILGSGWAVDPQYIRSQVASAIDILVQLTRDESGHRKIESIQRITGIQQGVILLSDPIGIETSGISASKTSKPG